MKQSDRDSVKQSDRDSVKQSDRDSVKQSDRDSVKQSVKPPHNVKLFKQLHVGSSNPVGMVSIGGPCCTTKV